MASRRNLLLAAVASAERAAYPAGDRARLVALEDERDPDNLDRNIPPSGRNDGGASPVKKPIG